MSDDGSVVDAVDEAASVLVLASGIGPAGDAVCGELLAYREPEETNAIGVVYNRTPDDWLSNLSRALGDAPARVRIVDAGVSGDGVSGDGVVVRGESPDDLTGIEIAVSEPVEAFSRADGETVFCFDSLTALLQYVDLELAYRFLNALTERLWRSGVRAHFHLDPAAHDDGTVATLAMLFDAVVAADAERLDRVDAVVDCDGTEVAVSRRPTFDPKGNA